MERPVTLLLTVRRSGTEGLRPPYADSQARIRHAKRLVGAVLREQGTAKTMRDRVSAVNLDEEGGQSDQVREYYNAFRQVIQIARSVFDNSSSTVIRSTGRRPLRNLDDRRFEQCGAVSTQRRK